MEDSLKPVDEEVENERKKTEVIVAAEASAEVHHPTGEVTEKQKIPDTRQSERLQQVLLEQMVKPPSKKRDLEGTNLKYENSFAVLDNIVIASLANDMGVMITEYEFDKVDMMKDLEIARHKLVDKNDKLLNNILLEEQ